MTLRTEISFSLAVAVKRDEHAHCFVSYCPAVDVYSAGETEEEAVKGIESAILMFVRNCFKRKILDNVLVARGFVPDEPSMDVPVSDTDASAEQFIQVRMREFGGRAVPVQISMPLASVSAPECRA